MMNLTLRVILILGLPWVALITGGYLLERWSHRKDADNTLQKFAEVLRESEAKSDPIAPKFRNLDPRFQKGLGMRYRGYTLPYVNQRWSALGTNLKFERLSLEIDLVFPFVYGGALAAALLLAWAAAGRPFAPIFIVAPVAIAVIADWTENLIQLGQLKLFDASKPDGGLDSTMIQLASVATMTKLFFLMGSYLFLVVLVFLMIKRFTK